MTDDPLTFTSRRQSRIEPAAIARLLDLVDGDTEELQDLIEDFDTGTPELIDDMRSASAASDLPGLRLAAHSLKSNALQFGATALAEMCERLEHSCDATPPSAADIDAIAAELSQARRALRATAPGTP